MHEPHPPSGDDRKRHKRELARARQRKKRKLDNRGFDHVTIPFSEVVVAALYWQAIDAGHTETEATAASTEKAKIAKGLSANHEHWAQSYIEKRRDGA